MPFRLRTRHHVRKHPKHIAFPDAATPSASYTAAQIAARYSYPVVPSSTQRVALIELGGGYTAADVAAYCSALSVPVPPIRAISVQGATNAPTGNPNSADGEVALDIQNIIGATGGKVAIDVYFAPNTSAGFAAAIAQVAADDVACACSISWGQDEAAWAASDVAAMEAALAACVARGIAVFAASGDGGSADGARGNNADYPASSPNVCGCGGTTITTTGEAAWASGGGGYSTKFARPAWQAIPGNARGVPDVAGDADPNSGYVVWIDGSDGVIGGTSAVAPMWAALTALLVTVTGQRIPLMAKALWAMPAGATTDITTGSDGAWKAAIGWDPCTGLGVPNGAKILAAMQGAVIQPPTTTSAPVLNSSTFTTIISSASPIASLVVNGVSIPIP